MVTILNECVEDKESNKTLELLNLDGLGKQMISELLTFWRKFRVQVCDLVQEAQLNILNSSVAQVKKMHLSGQTVVFTGTLASISRSEAKEQAKYLGIKAVASISKKTNFVVAGQKAGSKLKKAQDLGIKIYTEEEWAELYNKYKN